LCLFIVLALANEEAAAKEKRGIWSKRGLAWPALNDANNIPNIWAVAGNGWTKVSWLYTWSVWQDQESQVAGLDWVPMFWGTSHSSEFTSQLNAGAFAKCTAFLGFNEPERSDQANLSPQAAVNLWKQYIQPLKTKYPNMRLGAPAVSSAPAGKLWLQQFIPLCTGCTIDFIPIHWYGTGASNFEAYVTDIHNTFGKNIWVTEWAYTTGAGCAWKQTDSTYAKNMQPIYDFMGATGNWMEQQSWIERYSWFGAMQSLDATLDCDRLITADGTTNTPLGVQYATQP